MSYQAVPQEHEIIQADDEDLDALSFAPEAGPSQPLKPAPVVSGRIGSTPSGSSTTWGGVRIERRYAGQSTLDEPVSATIMRDLRSIYAKLLQVLYPPQGGSRSALRDWDLWGPLSPQEQAMSVFSLVISLVTIGSVIVTVNSKLLGGKVSFFQSLCVLGYALAPLLLASIVALLLHNLFVRVPVSLVCWAWSVWASVNFFNGTGLPEQRTALAVYPLCLFFFVLAWMIMIQ
ncbi:hypothetical protein CcaverHIS002_0302730 [Cutaneotrichosporon cavernicola]|uniref:Protein YIP n=1 Tax=Cutaneotrichosporon cavernicola TaxID=279322 RepID=A0AA48I2V2_9TREE|nr:uncharacterized protein CcaverHIS019_0302740 [Cutaneotrichosporon cavernicola]BEI82405.1 hypothetical protein CcaverHIS002_0302730 [Cutaneotrichosporon cavernicola]BEI90204.1 hypothetical protein CcaverHIS019_0302740 [Cutaneotrichosporon cavernicola]BEI97983.1 hypothetical protein CcaverHIS631_0302820 [Cutaneotrichosporon cavernicola]BEJ05759.1 hypothetical protein CcaverHIS641_0302810 [Cutaneotrichosporon cavernicola]